MEEEIRDEAQASGSWDLIRDVAILQVKLIVDGLRDLVLVPVSLIAGITSLVRSSDGRPGPQFYQLLGVGKDTERWINLFGAYSNRPGSNGGAGRFGDVNIDGLDDLVSIVEKHVVDEYRRGDITAQAKAGIDKALDTIQRKGRRNNRPE